MQATPSSKCIRWTYLATVSSWDIFSYMPRFTCVAATTWYHILFSTWTMVYILCVVHLLGCCELNFFVDKYYPSDSQSVPGKDMNKMCNIISRLLALGTASLFSRVKSSTLSPIMDSCLTRTKGTGLDSMVLCLLLPKASSVSHVTKISPQDNMSLQYAEAIGLHRWLGYV